AAGNPSACCPLPGRQAAPAKSDTKKTESPAWPGSGRLRRRQSRRMKVVKEIMCSLKDFSLSPIDKLQVDIAAWEFFFQAHGPFPARVLLLFPLRATLLQVCRRTPSSSEDREYPRYNLRLPHCRKRLRDSPSFPYQAQVVRFHDFKHLLNLVRFCVSAHI